MQSWHFHFSCRFLLPPSCFFPPPLALYTKNRCTCFSWSVFNILFNSNPLPLLYLHATVSALVSEVFCSFAFQLVAALSLRHMKGLVSTLSCHTRRNLTVKFCFFPLLFYNAGFVCFESSGGLQKVSFDLSRHL